MENHVSKLDVEFDVFSKGNLCLFAHSSDCPSAQCIGLDIQTYFSFLAVVDSNAEGRAADYGSAEQPASPPAVRLRPSTPLYDRLIDNLEQAAGQLPDGHASINYITNPCFVESFPQ